MDSFPSFLQKNIFLFFLFFIFFLPLFVFPATKMKQPVDISCNNNGICESEKQENLDTCPADCPVYPTGGESVDAVVLLEEDMIGPPIRIFNMEVLTGLGGTTITWETNKPTATLLVLSDETGEVKKSYSDDLYLIKHLMAIDNFAFDGNYFFKIFAKGIYGDDNYEEAQLFEIKQAYEEEFDNTIPLTSDSDEIEGGEDLYISIDSVISKTINSSPQNIDSVIISSPEKQSENSSHNFLKERIDKFKMTVLGLFIVNFFWQILIGVAILCFTILLIKKKV